MTRTDAEARERIRQALEYNTLEPSYVIALATIIDGLTTGGLSGKVFGTLFRLCKWIDDKLDKADRKR